MRWTIPPLIGQRRKIGRRAFLGLGMLGLGGAELPSSATELKRIADGFGRAQRCVLLFLTGGPPQHDTLDPKPLAPIEIRGELTSIPTSVPGIDVSELFPRLALCMHHFRVVRSVTHTDTVHTSAGYTMLTGQPHPLANTTTAALIRPQPDDHPPWGCVLARHLDGRSTVPSFVALPENIKDAAVNEFPGQGAGFLGRKYDPLLIESSADRERFLTPEIVLPPDVPLARFQTRQQLFAAIDSNQQLGDRVLASAQWAASYRRAAQLLESPNIRSAFDLDREPATMRQAYGTHLFGQGCLLARRLLEASVPFVTVYWHYEGPDDSPVWDTHWNNYPHLRNRLVPPTDAAVSALVQDLDQRGMLSDTLLIVMGEFGRTPRLNKYAGRDHWPHLQSILLAGAGIPGGSVYGSSDRQGAYPASKPVTPPALTATVLHLLGVPPTMHLPDRTGRPVLATTTAPLLDLIHNV